ncbi:MAG TPA: hypothetical protein VMF13_17255 [Luteitalea sp.]|nr:hypothetical protein [Luteitalea sp.]
MRNPNHMKRLAASASSGVLEHEHPLTSLLLGMYREMPGLKLTPPQAARLCSADPDACARSLEQLVHDGELRRGTQGDYLARN